MNPPYESFKDLAAGIQSWIISIAVLVGGGWTLYTFVALEMTKRAEKELFGQAQVNIKIAAKQEEIESGEPCVVAIVELTNAGGRNVFLDYSEKPFVVKRVSFDQAGNSYPREVLRQPNISASRVLRAGETVQYPFLVLVQDPGMYIVQFEVPLPRAEMEEHLKRGGPEGKIYWQGSTVLNVSGKGKK
jgi:hypothetical protein